MNIAFDTSYLQARRAGIGRYAEGLLRSLLSIDSSNSYILHGWSWSIDAPTIRRFTGPRVRFSLARIPGPLKRLYWSRIRVPAVETFVGPIDIFQSIDPLVPPTARARTVATVHDLALWKYPEFVESKVLSLRGAIERSIEKADALITPSEAIRSEIVSTLGVPGSKIHVVRPLVNPVFGPADESGLDQEVIERHRIREPYVLHVGTREPRKNTSALIRAFGALSKTLPGAVSLVLIGKRGWMYHETDAAFHTSPVKESIHHLDYVIDRDLSAIYRRAAAFVYPSWYEGYGSPLVEAMSSGLPIVTSDVPALKETVADAAIFVQPDREDEIVSALLSVLQQPEMGQQLRARSLSRASELRQDVPGKTLLKLYEELCR